MEHINKSSIKIMLAGHGNQAISTKLVDLKASPLLCMKLANLIWGALFKLPWPAYTSCFLKQESKPLCNPPPPLFLMSDIISVISVVTDACSVLYPGVFPA